MHAGTVLVTQYGREISGIRTPYLWTDRSMEVRDGVEAREGSEEERSK